MSVYDPIAGFYDAWSRSVVEDIAFYVELALASGGPVLELGVGTGRIAVPVAEAGIDITGVDSSREMLALCAARAEAAGVSHRVELEVGELSALPARVRARSVPLVIAPFRTLLHLRSRAARLALLRAIVELVEPGGRLGFDVFRPSADDVAETHGQWLEREPEIWERAEWNTSENELVLSVRGPGGETVMHLQWADEHEWTGLLRQAGFELEGAFGWFDRRPLAEGEDMVFVARRSTV